MATRYRITYNAPVILSFALVALVAHLIGGLFPGWFVAAPDLVGTKERIGLVTHVLGHASWEHLFGNLTLILLVGPVLEERHGSLALLGMMLTTAVVTGLAHAAFSDDYVQGASGIAFMMVLLASTTNVREGEIPLTLILIATIFLGGEIVGAFREDHVSQLAHLVGGGVGAAFGLLHAKLRTPPASPRGAAVEAVPPLAAMPPEPPGSGGTPSTAEPGRAASAGRRERVEGAPTPPDRPQ